MNAPFSHHAVIAALREENDILRETVRQLREDLAPRRGFPIAWRLRPQQATVLSCIMAASPGIATHNRIRASLYGGGEIPDGADDLIDVLLSGIRKRMRAAGVEHGFSNVFGVGYVMSVADRDRILAAPQGIEAEGQDAQRLGASHESPVGLQADAPSPSPPHPIPAPEPIKGDL